MDRFSRLKKGETVYVTTVGGPYKCILGDYVPTQRYWNMASGRVVWAYRCDILTEAEYQAQYHDSGDWLHVRNEILREETEAR